MEASDIKKLAHQFMGNAVKTSPGDHIWIEYLGPEARVYADACGAEVEKLGGTPMLVNSGADYINKVIGAMSVDEIKALGEKKLRAMQGMQGYIRITNDHDKAKVNLAAEQKAALADALKPMTDYRVSKTRWLVTATPTKEFAAACKMTFPEFEAFYRDVCLANYPLMEKAGKPLETIMADAKVRIYSPNQDTDLTLQTVKTKAIACVGSCNIPDGEYFTAPVRDSINGYITFGPSNYDGESFPWIRLELKDGKITKAESKTAEQTKALNRILDVDEGARYAGEFAINFNPYVLHPTGNILFDEKIAGGIHIAFGQCYDDAPNGNASKNHWDMVHIQRPDYGGGELYINDRLIRKDGIFVVPELLGLNPENLKAATGSSPATPQL